MGDVASAFSSGASQLGSSAMSALGGMGSAFSSLAGEGGGSSGAGGGSSAPPSQAPTPAQTEPAISPQATQAMSVNPPVTPTTPDPNQNQNPPPAAPAQPPTTPSMIEQIIKSLGFTGQGNPWSIGSAEASILHPNLSHPNLSDPMGVNTPTPDAAAPDASHSGYPDTGAAAPTIPIGGGAGNVQEAPTGTPAPASKIPIGGGAGNVQEAPTGTPGPKIALGGGPGNEAEAPSGTPAADVPAAAATPVAATGAPPASAPDAGGAAGGGGQMDPGQLFQQIIMPLLGAALGGGGMGGLLGLAMQALGGGMGGFGGGGFGRGRFGRFGHPGFMFPGRGFGGMGQRGMWPYWHPNFGWRMHNQHPGGLWQPHPGGMAGPNAGRDWAASRYGGGAVPGANAMRGRGRIDPANIQPISQGLDTLGVPRGVQAGVVAGLMGESGAGLDPTSFNSKDPGGGSGGIGQWNRGRLTGPSGMLAFAQNHGVPNIDPMNPRDALKVPRNIQTQYLMSELQSPQFAPLLNALRHARTPQEALQLWVNIYENPRDKAAAYAQRSGYLGSVGSLIAGGFQGGDGTPAVAGAGNGATPAATPDNNDAGDVGGVFGNLADTVFDSGADAGGGDDTSVAAQ